MSSFLDNVGLLLARIGIGVLFLTRGLLNLFGGSVRWIQIGSRMEYLNIHSAFPLWGILAAFLVTCGGILIMIGLRLRPVAVILAFLSFLALASQAQNIGIVDLAQSLSALLILAGLFCTGAGSFSLDAYLTDQNKQD